MEVPSRATTAQLRVDTVVRLFALAIAFAVCGWLVTQSIRVAFGHETQRGLVGLFDLNGEANVPTWVSTTLIFAAAAVAALNAAAEKPLDGRTARAWAILAGGLAYLSVDEAASLHEQLSHGLHAWLPGAGSYPVVQFAAMSALALAGALACRPLLATLPVRTRVGLIAAGLLYVVGAAGADALGGLWVDGTNAHRKSDVVYLVLTTLEEAGEFLGMLLFVRVAGGHLERRHGSLGFHAAEPD